MPSAVATYIQAPVGSKQTPAISRGSVDSMSSIQGGKDGWFLCRARCDEGLDCSEDSLRLSVAVDGFSGSELRRFEEGRDGLIDDEEGVTKDPEPSLDISVCVITAEFL